MKSFEEDDVILKTEEQITEERKSLEMARSTQQINDLRASAQYLAKKQETENQSASGGLIFKR